MIVYSKRWCGLPLLFRIKGTAWPQGIFPALVSVAVGVVISEVPMIDDVVRDRSKFMDHPYPFQLYAFIIGFLIVFRTNFAYQRYWEGRGTIAQMATKWLDGACMSVCFDAPGDVNFPFLEGVGDGTTKKGLKRTPNGAPSHETFVHEILHLFSLMHALALQHLRGDGNIDNLQGFSMSPTDIYTDVSYSTPLTHLPETPQHSNRLSKISKTYDMGRNDYNEVYRAQHLNIIGHIRPEERRALEMDGRGLPIPTEARVTMVESWIMRRLLARQKHEKADMEKTAPPILSRLYQVISDGCIGFGQASKIADTPFPFPYQNLIQIFLWIYVLTVPLVMNAWLKEPVLRVILTFIAVWCYFALNQVGNNLEDPYIPYDPNEIALTHCQHSFNARLLSYMPVPEPVPMPEIAPPKEENTAQAVPVKTAAAPSTQQNDSNVTVTVSPDANVTVTVPTQKDSQSPRPAPSGHFKNEPQQETKLVQNPQVRTEQQQPANPNPAHGLSLASQANDGNAEQLGPMVQRSLQELAAMHARYLHTIAVLEGAISQHPQHQPGQLPLGSVADVAARMGSL